MFYLHVMNDNQIKKLCAEATQKLTAGVTKKEAILVLKAAGILKSTGKFSKQYSNLARVVTIQK